MGDYNRKHKQMCCKCRKYGHKPGNRKCPEYKKKMKEMKEIRKQKEMTMKIKIQWSMLSLQQRRTYESGWQRKEIW